MSILINHGRAVEESVVVYIERHNRLRFLGLKLFVFRFLDINKWLTLSGVVFSQFHLTASVVIKFNLEGAGIIFKPTVIWNERLHMSGSKGSDKILVYIWRQIRVGARSNGLRNHSDVSHGASYLTSLNSKIYLLSVSPQLKLIKPCAFKSGNKMREENIFLDFYLKTRKDMYRKDVELKPTNLANKKR